MDGLGRAVGAPAHVMYRGQLFPIYLRLIELGEIENFLLSTKDPFIAVDSLRGTDVPLSVVDQVREDVGNIAADCYVSTHEVQVFVDSREGIAFVLWMNLRKHGENFENISAWVNSLNWNEVQKLSRQIARAGGVDELSDCDFPKAIKSKSVAEEEYYERTNWRLLFHNTFENGIGPPGLGEMTMFQLRCAGTDEKELKNKASISKEIWFSMTKEERLALIEKNRKFRSRRKRRIQ